MYKWLYQGENSINQVSLTVVQKAILEATKSVGKFRVNWDWAESPNIMYPITAAPAYNTVTIAKLHPYSQWTYQKSRICYLRKSRMLTRISSNIAQPWRCFDVCIYLPGKEDSRELATFLQWCVYIGKHCMPRVTISIKSNSNRKTRKIQNSFCALSAHVID